MRQRQQMTSDGGELALAGRRVQLIPTVAGRWPSRTTIGHGVVSEASAVLAGRHVVGVRAWFERWPVQFFRAGRRSARDPRHTVAPRRDRIRRQDQGESPQPRLTGLPESITRTVSHRLTTSAPGLSAA